MSTAIDIEGTDGVKCWMDGEFMPDIGDVEVTSEYKAACVAAAQGVELPADELRAVLRRSRRSSGDYEADVALLVERRRDATESRRGLERIARERAELERRYGRGEVRREEYRQQYRQLGNEESIFRVMVQSLLESADPAIGARIVELTSAVESLEEQMDDCDRTIAGDELRGELDETGTPRRRDLGYWRKERDRLRGVCSRVQFGSAEAAEVQSLCGQAESMVATIEEAKRRRDALNGRRLKLIDERDRLPNDKLDWRRAHFRGVAPRNAVGVGVEPALLHSRLNEPVRMQSPQSFVEPMVRTR